MMDNQEAKSILSSRERELELEVARLQAEVDTLKGEDAVTATSRFLAMAAATVDQAVEDARREADEIVEEVSGQAEARRDEATRVAAEAEAIAEEKLAEADRAQEAIDEATETATAIKAAAEEEAAKIVLIERERVATETEAFADVRRSLADERGALETYHADLRRKVHELAESVVSFMNTESSAGTGLAIENLTIPQLDVAPGETSTEEESTETVADEADEAEVDGGVIDPLDTPGLGHESVPLEDDQIVDMPDTAIDEIPAGQVSTFGGVPVLDVEPADEVGDEDADLTEIDDDKPVSAGLFSRARPDEGAAESTSGLFRMFGPRLVEQTSPDELAEALEADDDDDDQAFRQFLDGDDAPDASRDWLLRPEQG